MWKTAKALVIGAWGPGASAGATLVTKKPPEKKFSFLQQD